MDIEFGAFCYLYVIIGRILDFSNADTAVDQYHRFEVNSLEIYIGLTWK